MEIGVAHQSGRPKLVAPSLRIEIYLCASEANEVIFIDVTSIGI